MTNIKVGYCRLNDFSYYDGANIYYDGCIDTTVSGASVEILPSKPEIEPCSYKESKVNPFTFYFSYQTDNEENFLCPKIYLTYTYSFFPILTFLFLSLFILNYNIRDSREGKTWFTVLVFVLVFVFSFLLNILFIYIYGLLDFLIYIIIFCLLISVAGYRRELKSLFCGFLSQEDILPTEPTYHFYTRKTIEQLEPTTPSNETEEPDYAGEDDEYLEPERTTRNDDNSDWFVNPQRRATLTTIPDTYEFNYSLSDSTLNNSRVKAKSWAGLDYSENPAAVKKEDDLSRRPKSSPMLFLEPRRNNSTKPNTASTYQWHSAQPNYDPNWQDFEGPIVPSHSSVDFS